MAFLDVVREARVFARVRNRGELEVPAEMGEVEGSDCAGVEDWDASDPSDCDLDVIGTVRC